MNSFIKVLALLLSFIVIIEKSILKLGIGDIYYIIIIAILFFLLLTGKRVNFNYFMIWFILAASLSIVFNDIPSFFKPSYRLISFIMVVGLVGPMIRSTTLYSFRYILFSRINYIIIIFVLLSFVSIALSLPLSKGRGGYVGLFLHSNFLSPIAALSVFSLVKIAIEQKKKYLRHLLFLGAMVSFLTCLIAGSRASLLGLIGGLVFYTYKLNQHKLTNFIKTLLIIAALSIVSYPLWESYAETIIRKTSYSEQQGNVFYTRENRWNSRISEFRSSPVFGVGFASVDITVDQRYNELDGQIEPGSSWLALLSMTGLLGFMSIFIFILRTYNYLYKIKIDRSKFAYFGGLLTFFILHMFAEGYITAAGNTLFFYFWLLMGVIEGDKTYKYNWT